MNKLGFAINYASAGLTTALVCNKGQWTSKVIDIREYFKLFAGLANIEHGSQVSTGNFATFMFFDCSGCFITQMKALNGRIGDFLAGWIFIPNTIEATGDEIMNTYNYVRNILSLSNLNESIEEIKEFFSKEYPKQEYAAQYIPSSGEEFGVRFINLYYSMKEILDADRYQPYYSNYKAVFLLDKDGEVRIASEQNPRFKDITQMAIDKTCIFKAPTPEEASLLGRGVKIVFSNTKQEFKSPVLTKKGDRIQLLALREGFEPVPLPVITIQEDGQKYNIDPSVVKWKKRITFSMFTVYNHKQEKIEGVRITVNGAEITSRHDVYLFEDECRQATVKYSAPDYEPYEHKRNLLLNEFVEIKLDRKVKRYQTKIELANGNIAAMTLESEYLSSNNDSPLKGYEYEENFHADKLLRMSSMFVWKERLRGFFAALAVIISMIAYASFDSWLDTHHFKIDLPPWEENRPAQQYNSGGTIEVNDNTQSLTANQGEQKGSVDISLEAAIKYLDSNSTWSKSQLEIYPDLKGLFDDLNNYHLDKILNKWYKKLSVSKKFLEVCKSAQKVQNNASNLKRDDHAPTYNKPDDEQISITNYINWLDQNQTPISSSNNGGFHPNGGRNGANNDGTSRSTSGNSRTSPSISENNKGETPKNGGL